MDLDLEVLGLGQLGAARCRGTPGGGGGGGLLQQLKRDDYRCGLRNGRAPPGEIVPGALAGLELLSPLSSLHAPSPKPQSFAPSGHAPPGQQASATREPPNIAEFRGGGSRRSRPASDGVCCATKRMLAPFGLGPLPSSTFAVLLARLPRDLCGPGLLLLIAEPLRAFLLQRLDEDHPLPHLPRKVALPLRGSRGAGFFFLLPGSPIAQRTRNFTNVDALLCPRRLCSPARTRIPDSPVLAMRWGTERSRPATQAHTQACACDSPLVLLKARHAL